MASPNHVSSSTTWRLAAAEMAAQSDSTANHDDKTPRDAPDYRRLAFQVRDLPAGCDTKAVHAKLRPLGNIVGIEIEPLRHPRTHAFVTFQPPPPDLRPFRSGITMVGPGGRQSRVRFIQKEIRHLESHPSPVDARREFAEQTRVNVSRMEFGVADAPDSLLLLSSTDRATGVGVNTHPRRRRLELAFDVPATTSTVRRSYRMEINFAQIASIYSMPLDTGDHAFVVTCNAPPNVYRKRDDLARTHVQGGLRWFEHNMWYRQTDISQHANPKLNGPLQIRPDDAAIDVGRWLSVRFVLDRTAMEKPAVTEICDVLNAHTAGIVSKSVAWKHHTAPGSPWPWLNPPEPGSLSDMQQLMTQDAAPLPFPLRYQLEVCISQGLLHESNISEAFLCRLSRMAAKDPEDLDRAIRVLEKVAHDEKRWYDPDAIFHRVVPKAPPTERQRVKMQHSQYIKARSATVTPTTIYFYTPSIEPSNRVIRQYRRYEDRFLRIKFTDENYRGRLFSARNETDAAVFQRVLRTLNHGITIGERRYEFLAFGNSQFREHGAYFFASTGDVTAQSIRDWMGNFTHIKVIAKYCSRIGQCFTTTRSVQTRNPEVSKIPDVERNGFNFTDGVGKLSPFLAKMIGDEYGLLQIESEGGHYPSVFQFRLGGCKGVLAVDPTMTARSVAIRPSQEKFSAVQHTGLEICRVSQLTSSYLNMQIILVLAALGVEDGVFVRKLKHMLSEMESAMQDQDKALERLQKDIDTNQMTLQLAKMVHGGFMTTNEPFVISCLRLWRSWVIKHLKEKAKIGIEKGAFLLGTVDETGQLCGDFHTDTTRTGAGELAEIFVQIRDVDHPGQYRIVEGICLLVRNPSLHPGDIRVVRAVNAPSLHHLRDCVVLPSTGYRDLANMCSGGDLDGDDYMVMWDPDLLPAEWNHAPMNYEAPPPLLTTGAVGVQDMANFFVQHMQYDRLGQIATFHRYWADQLEDGVKDPVCLELAQLHSQAVDYPKTGVPAEVPDRLRPPSVPHWAEPRPHRRSHHSKRVLGKLYDAVRRVDFEPAWDLPFDDRVLSACDPDEEALGFARELKPQYDEAVRRIMSKYSIGSEFEVWTTFALDFARDLNGYKFAEKLGEEVAGLKQLYRTMYFDKITPDGTDVPDPARIQALVVAAYAVTNHELRAALAETQQTKLQGGTPVPVRPKTPAAMPFISFPWLFTLELRGIVTRRRDPAAAEVAPLWQPLLPRKKPVVVAAPRPSALPADVAPPPLPDLPEIQTADGPVRTGEVLDLYHKDNADAASRRFMLYAEPTPPPSPPSRSAGSRSTDSRSAESPNGDDVPAPHVAPSPSPPVSVIPPADAHAQAAVTVKAGESLAVDDDGDAAGPASAADAAEGTRGTGRCDDDDDAHAHATVPMTALEKLAVEDDGDAVDGTRGAGRPPVAPPADAHATVTVPVTAMEKLAVDDDDDDSDFSEPELVTLPPPSGLTALQRLEALLRDET